METEEFWRQTGGRCLPGEEWRPAAEEAGCCDGEAPGRYEVSALGRVRSLKSSIVMKQRVEKGGYPRVMLRIGGEAWKPTVHTLVLTAFDRPREDGEQCNHINGVKTDNRSRNPEWTTRTENMEHAKRTGLRDGARGENHDRALLTEEEVLRIRELHGQGMGYRDIADRVGHP